MKRNPLTYIFLCLVSMSCNAQVETGTPKTKTEQQTAKPKLVRTQGTDEYANVHCSLQDQSGNWWFGTTGEGLYRFDGKNFINFLEKDGLSSNSVWSMYEDKAGNLLFGTDDGVCLYNPASNSFTVMRMWESPEIDYVSDGSSAPAKNPVHAIFQDKKGEYWFGTDGGVFRYKGSLKEEKKDFTRFIAVSEKDLQLKRVSGIIQDKSGNIWFASWNNEGACWYDGNMLSSFNPNGDSMVYSVLEDKNGNLWFGTREHGVCRSNPNGKLKTVTNFADIPTFSSSCVYSMTQDKTGNIWFGTEFGSGAKEDKKGGVWRYDPATNAFTNFTVAGDGLSNNSVFTVLKDQSDDLWFGTRNTGLCKFDPTAKGNKFIPFSE